MTRADKRKSLGVKSAKHAEVDKTVIKRRYQRVGHRLRKPGQETFMSRGIDLDIIAVIREFGDNIRELLRAFRRLVRVCGDELVIQANVIRNTKNKSNALSPGTPVRNVMREAALSGIEVDRRDPLTQL